VSPVPAFKARKKSCELIGLAEACKKDSAAFASFLASLEVRLLLKEPLQEPLRESEVGKLLSERRGKFNGFLGDSFETIAAVRQIFCCCPPVIANSLFFVSFRRFLFPPNLFLELLSLISLFLFPPKCFSSCFLIVTNAIILVFLFNCIQSGPNGAIIHYKPEERKDAIVSIVSNLRAVATILASHFEPISVAWLWTIGTRLSRAVALDRFM
jgi:hypothetical protein